MNIDYSNFLSTNLLLPSISTVGQPASAAPAAVAPVEENSDALSFQDLLSQAMGGTVVTDAAAKLGQLGLITGESEDLHDLTIASSQADIMLNLTVQIRNRMVEGYQEIMRMQI